MPETSSILIYGHDLTLLDTRRWVLEREGYRVLTATEGTAAEAEMTKEPVDLLLLCHTLSAKERVAALDLAAERHPRMKRLSFTTIMQELGQRPVSGETVDSFAGAMGLLSAVRKILNQNTKS